MPEDQGNEPAEQPAPTSDPTPVEPAEPIEPIGTQYFTKSRDPEPGNVTRIVDPDRAARESKDG